MEEEQGPVHCRRHACRQTFLPTTNRNGRAKVFCSDSCRVKQRQIDLFLGAVDAMLETLPKARRPEALDGMQLRFLVALQQRPRRADV